ncbi:MAG: undecaprenyl-diphosphatase UppP [Chlorobiaceae bacterium]|nr:undecaprenyl-diphosphatase UppP [Chlorobiaceae bacterium]
MNLAEAALLGLVQGLTEFLPISSTAHIRIVPALLGWEDPGAAFTAIIQLGTLAAVLLYFRNDIIIITRAVFRSVLRGRPLETPESKTGWMIAAGTVPIVVFGLLFKSQIETTLRSLYWISGALIILGLVLTLAELKIKLRLERNLPLKTMQEIGWKETFIVGFAQCVALIPGSSRSGVTITGGLLANLDRSTAARFSFLLSLPSVFAAALLEFYHNWQGLLSSPASGLNLAVATLAAGISGYAAIAFLINYLKRHTTTIFIVYRIIAGTVILFLLSAGLLKP